MAYVWQRWMADEYRAAGLEVIEIEGWKNRGRPASTGHFDPRGPETVHHTGSTSSRLVPRPSLNTLIVGRSDLPGPLSQKATDYHGVVILIAAGRANHAGRVGKRGVPGMPLGADGNALALGDEVMTNGIQALTPAQRRSIAIQSAVDLAHFGHDDADYAHRHEDISSTGKWDLGSLTTDQLRDDVRAALEEIDMPSAEEIARAVWNQQLRAAGGDRVRAGRLLVQTHNRSDVGRRLRAIAADLAELTDHVKDDATRAQAHRIRRGVDEVLARLEEPAGDVVQD